MTSNTTTLCLVVLGCTACGGALAEDKTDGQWRGTGGAALSVTSGNTTSSSLLINAEASRATTIDKITLGGAMNYAKSKIGGVDQTTANKWGAFGEYDYNLSPQMFVFGRLGFDADKVIDLSLRTSLAAGLGYKVINTKETTFDVYGGLGYTTDKYSLAQTINGTTDTSFSRASIYLGEASSHVLSPTVSFKQRLDLYPGVSGDKAILAKFNAGLSVAMSSTLNLSVGLIDTYNSKPPAGTKSNDIGLFTGVNVKFGAI
jgi:putative salt-induced outer membrane protein